MAKGSGDPARVPWVYSSKDAKDIRALSPETRRCFFPDEGYPHPTLYSQYTADNCKLECRMREAEKAVGCVPWYLPQVS